MSRFHDNSGNKLDLALTDDVSVSKLCSTTMRTFNLFVSTISSEWLPFRYRKCPSHPSLSMQLKHTDRDATCRQRLSMGVVVCVLAGYMARYLRSLGRYVVFRDVGCYAAI
jgi:hypothetical protein